MKEFLQKASNAYYAGNPIITDDQFDSLAESFGFNALGEQPTGNVHKHVHRMYSLDKYYEGEGKCPLSEYPDSDKVRTPKLDGAALSTLYVDGKFTRALTRGDGIEGVVITDKFSATKLIPHSIRLQGVYQIDGEIAAPKHIENARNYAAGALNLKDPEEFKTRAVNFFAYRITPSLTGSYLKDLDLLKRMGFETVLSKNLTDIYPIDGLVFRLDSYEEYNRLGHTAKFPRGAFALKTRGEAVETTLIDVEWQVGKSGKVTPVAILEPVKVGDSTVARATLNNQAFIEALGLCIGDTVGIIKAGEIIPQIVYRVE